MLWIGAGLSALERACMRSVLAQGHPLTLYCYDQPRGVPEGVMLADAEAVVSREAIVLHQSGSPALFSNWFRYELQRRALGIWLDSDVYLLKPLEVDPGRPLFGWCEAGVVGTSVLHLPRNSPIISTVIELFERPYVPSWLRWRDRVRAHLRNARDGRVDLGRLPWGVAGPTALTALVRRYGLIDAVAPAEIYYPWTYHEATWIFDPVQDLEARVSPVTRALHLYNYLIAAQKAEPAAPGSFMARLQREGA